MIDLSLLHFKTIWISIESVIWVKPSIHFPIDGNIPGYEVSSWDRIKLNLEMNEFLKKFWRKSQLDESLLQKRIIFLFVFIWEGDCVLIYELSLLINDVSAIDCAILKWKLLIELSLESINTFRHSMKYFFLFSKIRIKFCGILCLFESFVIFKINAESLIYILRWVQILKENIIWWTNTQNLELCLVSLLNQVLCLKSFFFGFNLLLDLFLLYISNSNDFENRKTIGLELSWNYHFEVRFLFLIVVEMSLLENIRWHIDES